MLSKMILTLVAVGMFEVMPVLADENCDDMTKTEDGSVQCDLKGKPVQPERIIDEANLDLHKNSARELENMKENSKEDNDLLEELNK